MGSIPDWGAKIPYASWCGDIKPKNPKKQNRYKHLYPTISKAIRWLWTSLVAQTVNRLPTMWETWVQSLGWEDLLEKEMATHSSALAWKIP